MALPVVHSDVLGQQFLVRVSQKRLSGVMHVEKAAVSHPPRDVMSGRVGGVVESSCMRYSDKADSDDYTMAAALVFLFSRGFWRRWTFLFLEFPDYPNQLMESLVYVHADFG